MPIRTHTHTHTHFTKVYIVYNYGCVEPFFLGKVYPFSFLVSIIKKMKKTDMTNRHFILCYLFFG